MLRSAQKRGGRALVTRVSAVLQSGNAATLGWLLAETRLGADSIYEKRMVEAVAGTRSPNRVTSNHNWHAYYCSYSLPLSLPAL